MKETIHPFIGKQFVEQTIVPIESKYGGPDFIEFHDETQASIKKGDIMYLYQYEIQEDSIFCTNEYSDAMVFFIKDASTLIYKDIDWILKN